MSNVKDFGARGDGVNDDTDAILNALEAGDGTLTFPRGDYLITRTVPIDLARTGRFGMDGSAATAKIVMAGAGPAFHITGTHEGTASPDSFKPGVWDRQRMPTILNLEIQGKHADADGFLIEGAMQPTFEGVTLCNLRDGIRLHGRCRNLLISHCHIYNNCGAGVFLDRVNLHQAIVTGSHISYCRRGGIKLIASEVRNLQITGNDIEYNFDRDADVSADIWIDASEEGSSVREGTVVGNTIQAQYSPGGCNVLIIGRNVPEGHYKAGMVSISDNLIGTQETNIRLRTCRGVVITGNVIYGARRRNLHAETSQNIVVGPNSFDHNPDYHRGEFCTGVRFSDSHGCVVNGCVIQDCESGPSEQPDAETSRSGLLEIIRCRRVNISGCQILDAYPGAIHIEDAQDVSVSHCTLLETRAEVRTVRMLSWKGAGNGNALTGNRIGAGIDGALDIDDAAGVQTSGNVVG